MISPIQARCDTFAYLEEKYSELLDKADKLIKEEVSLGNFKAKIALSDLTACEQEQFKRLLEREGYIVKFHYNENNTLVIEW